MKLPWNRGGSGGSGEQPFQPQPDKAKKFFEHASTAAASSNFEFALQLYADGLKLDPGNMAAHQAMYEAAVRYVNGGGKPATGKELRKIDDGGTKVSKMAAAEFTWMKDLNSLAAATRLLEAASEAEQHALGQWLAPKVMALVKNQARKKPSKSLMVQAKDAFAGVGAWDEAFICADEALKIDPSDGKLASELKQLTAARAIQQGGYNQTVGQAGGFRSNVRDMDKQRALEEAGSLSGGAVQLTDSPEKGAREGLLVDCTASMDSLALANEMFPTHPIVAVVGEIDAPNIMEALARGADGVIALKDPPEMWRECVHVVLGGGRWLGGPGLDVQLEDNSSSYDIATNQRHKGDITLRTKLFVRSRLADKTGQ